MGCRSGFEWARSGRSSSGRPPTPSSRKRKGRRALLRVGAEGRVDRVLDLAAALRLDRGHLAVLEADRDGLHEAVGLPDGGGAAAAVLNAVLGGPAHFAAVLPDLDLAR